MTTRAPGNDPGTTVPPSVIEAREDGRTIEGVLTIRRALDDVELPGTALFVEETCRFPAHMTDDLLPGEIAGADQLLEDDDDLVDELVERVSAGHGRVVRVPDGTLDELGGVVLVVGERAATTTPMP